VCIVSIESILRLNLHHECIPQTPKVRQRERGRKERAVRRLRARTVAQAESKLERGEERVERERGEGERD